MTDVSQDGGDPDPDHDGNPNNNGTPTVFLLPVSVILIPTLDGWGLGLLAVVLGWAAVVRVRRRGVAA